MSNLKLVHIIGSLPPYTQVAVMYPLLGSLNASIINAATRIVAENVRVLDAAEHAATLTNGAPPISIDKYNEFKNELRSGQLDEDWQKENSPDADTPRIDNGLLIERMLTIRKPLLAMFNATQAKLPNPNGEPADFSIEESLARQMAREFDTERALRAEMDAELIKAGVTSAEEIAEVERERFEKQQDFTKEFRFLIRDEINNREPVHVDDDEANDAFNELDEEMQRRLLARIIPKLLQSKRQNLGRRTYDPDASTNVLIIGMAIDACKEVIGETDADDRLAKMREAAGKTKPDATTEETPAEPAEATS
jgi:hypothetical protein